MLMFLITIVNTYPQSTDLVSMKMNPLKLSCIFCSLFNRRCVSFLAAEEHVEKFKQQPKYRKYFKTYAKSYLVFEDQNEVFFIFLS